MGDEAGLCARVGCVRRAVVGGAGRQSRRVRDSPVTPARKTATVISPPTNRAVTVPAAMPETPHGSIPPSPKTSTDETITLTTLVAP